MASDRDLTTLADSVIERFWADVTKSDGCWEWRGNVSPIGYGRIFMKRQRVRSQFYAHRVSYRIHHGAIPEGAVLDHLCRNRRCVNPEHLEAVTNRENILRGTSPIAKCAKATHCRRGHPYSGTNLYRKRDGSRGCRECTRQAQRAAWARKGPSKVCAGTTRSGAPCQQKVRIDDYCGRHKGRCRES